METILLLVIAVLITVGAFICVDILEKLDEEEHKKQEDAKHFTIQF